MDMSRLHDTARHAYRRVRGLPLPTLVLRGHKSIVASVAYLPDGKQVISGPWDSSIRIWIEDDPRKGRGPVGGTLRIGVVGALPGLGEVVNRSNNGTVIVWNTTTGKRPAGPLKGHTRVVQPVFSGWGLAVTDVTYASGTVTQADCENTFVGPEVVVSLLS